MFTARYIYCNGPVLLVLWPKRTWFYVCISHINFHTIQIKISLNWYRIQVKKYLNLQTQLIQIVVPSVEFQRRDDDDDDVGHASMMWSPCSLDMVSFMVDKWEWIRLLPNSFDLKTNLEINPVFVIIRNQKYLYVYIYIKIY